MPYIMIDVILIYDSFGGPLQLGAVLAFYALFSIFLWWSNS